MSARLTIVTSIDGRIKDSHHNTKQYAEAYAESLLGNIVASSEFATTAQVQVVRYVQ